VTEEEDRLEAAHKALLAREIQACIKRLPEEVQVCLQLRKNKGLPYDVIAREVGATKAAVAMRIKRARAFLRKELAERGFDLSEFFKRSKRISKPEGLPEAGS
jgi:RNA polymerase sigma factor (sigma-70 family)